MFTKSQAIQQSHFLSAESVWAVRISTVTQQSRYGSGLAGKYPTNHFVPIMLISQPHTRARTSTSATIPPLCGHDSIDTFRSPLPEALSSPLRG